MKSIYINNAQCAVLLLRTTQMDLFNYILINSTYYENNKRCVLTVSKEPVTMFAPIVFGLTKNGPFTQAISEQYVI